MWRGDAGGVQGSWIDCAEPMQAAAQAFHSRAREPSAIVPFMARLLVVDDDSHIREVMRYALSEAGHEIVEAADGREALKRFAAERFDLVVLDIVMPEADGLTVCRKLRETSQVPILFVSSRDDELDRVLGLELGGDDYLGKPFSPRELVARVKALLRRASSALTPHASAAEEHVRHGPLALDLMRHRCTWAGHELVLTVTEFALLATLARAPGRVFNRDQLVDQAYGEAHVITERTVDSHIRRVRQKLAVLGADPIETVYGLGYRLRERLA